MPEFFKSKAGMLLAGLQLLTVFSCLMYLHLIDGNAVWPFLISLVLSSPWYLLLFYLLIPLGLGQAAVGKLTSQDFIMIAIVSTAIGALINAFILYLLGFLLAKMFHYLSAKKEFAKGR